MSCRVRTCDHMVRIGRAYVDSDQPGSWNMVTDGGHSSGTRGRDALEDAAGRHCYELRTYPAATGGTFEGYHRVSRTSFEVWALDWSHAPA